MISAGFVPLTSPNVVIATAHFLRCCEDYLTQKKAGFPCNGLNAGSYFISQDEG